jgi:acetyl esterase
VPDLHPQVQALLEEAARDGGGPAPADLEAQRAGYLATAQRLGGAREPVAEARDVVIDGRLRARAYRPKVTAVPLGALVWLHGGGWLMGDLEGFDHVCRALAVASGHVVVSVQYRLAPEHPFPAAVQDARTAVAWALGHGAGQLGYDAGRVAVGGDSAGGNLAASAALGAGASVRGQLLVYPALDAAMESASYAEFADGPMLTAEEMARCYEAYLGAADRADPDASPLRRSDLSGAPTGLRRRRRARPAARRRRALRRGAARRGDRRRAARLRRHGPRLPALGRRGGPHGRADRRARRRRAGDARLSLGLGPGS